ncbi:putative porin [Agaribacterium sp. ZY112]|uniref:putative porin n=1 Tax=Agaribacterium sp. ZY112 TaxID=3233574 RepID=UPI003524014E
MKKLAWATILAATASTSVFAGEYQSQVGLDLGQNERDTSATDTLRSKHATLVGTFYTRKVDTSKGPLAEAAFLDKATDFTAYYTRNDADSDDVNLDDSYGMSGRIVNDDDWILELAYDYDDSANVGIGIGKYITDTLDIVFSYTGNKDDDEQTFAAKVHGLSGKFGYNAYFAFLEQEQYSGNKAAGDITYYLNDNLGFGFQANTESLEEMNHTGYGLFADWFVKENIELKLSADRVDHEMELTEYNLVLGAAMRF